MILRKSRIANDSPITADVLRIDALVLLRAGDRICGRVDTRDLSASAAAHRIGVTKRIDVDAKMRSDVTAGFASVSEIQRGTTIGMTGNDPQRHASGAAAIGQIDKNRLTLVDQRIAFIVLEADVVRRLWTDEQHVVPCDFRLWLRQFLQPSVVREAAIVDRWIRLELKFKTRWPLAVGRWPNCR